MVKYLETKLFKSRDMFLMSQDNILVVPRYFALMVTFSQDVSKHLSYVSIHRTVDIIKCAKSMLPKALNVPKSMRRYKYGSMTFKWSVMPSLTSMNNTSEWCHMNKRSTITKFLSLQQIYLLVVFKYTFMSLFVFGDTKFILTTFVMLGMSLKVKGDKVLFFVIYCWEYGNDNV